MEETDDEIKRIDKEAASIEAEAKSIEAAASTIITPAPTSLPPPTPMQTTVIVTPTAPAPKPVITIGADGKPRVAPPAKPAVTIDKATGMPIINEDAGEPVVPVAPDGKPIPKKAAKTATPTVAQPGMPVAAPTVAQPGMPATVASAPVMTVSKDGKPMVKASALGGVTTAASPVAAPTAAVAAAMNPTATNQATVMRPAAPVKPKATATGMPAALAPKVEPQTPQPVDEEPDPVKKAVAETLKKKAKEKEQKTPSEWSSEIVRRAVAGTDVQMGGNLYMPTTKTDPDQVIKTKPTAIPDKPVDKRGQIISSYTSTNPKVTSNKVDLIPEAVPQPQNTWTAINKPKSDRNSKYDWKTNVQPDASQLAPKLEYTPPTPAPAKKLTPKARNDLAAQRPEVAKPKTLSMQPTTNVTPADTQSKAAAAPQKTAALV